MEDNQSQEKYKSHHAYCKKKVYINVSQLVIVVIVVIVVPVGHCCTPLELLFDKTQLFGKFGPATQFQRFIVISFALCDYFNIPALG